MTTIDAAFYIGLCLASPLTLLPVVVTGILFRKAIGLSEVVERNVQLATTFVLTIPNSVKAVLVVSAIAPMYFQNDASLVDKYVVNGSFGLLAGSLFYIMTSHLTDYRHKKKCAQLIMDTTGIILLNVKNKINYSGFRCEDSKYMFDVFVKGMEDSCLLNFLNEGGESNQLSQWLNFELKYIGQLLEMKSYLEPDMVLLFVKLKINIEMFLVVLGDYEKTRAEFGDAFAASHMRLAIRTDTIHYFQLSYVLKKYYLLNYGKYMPKNYWNI